MKAMLRAIKRRLATDSRYTPYYNRLQWWLRGRRYATREISACHQCMYQELAHLCLQEQPAMLLEFGCGDAYLLRQIHARNPGTQLFGCDFSQTQLKEAQKLLPEANLQYQDIRSTTYDNRAFGVAIGVSVLMYLSPRDLVRALTELRRISDTVISVEMDCRYLSKEKIEAFRRVADGRFDHDYEKGFSDAGFKNIQSRRIDAFYDPQINTLKEMGFGMIVARG